VLVDDFLPVYDVSDSVATVVQSDLATTWDALMEVDLIEVGRRRPMVAALLRVLPELVTHLLHGEAPPSGAQQLRLRDLSSLPREHGGWVLLGERPRNEVAMGLIGKFWRPVITYATTVRFRRYWTLGVGSGAHVLVGGLLDVTREMAEGREKR
jgi:hypothetical protein